MRTHNDGVNFIQVCIEEGKLGQGDGSYAARQGVCSYAGEAMAGWGLGWDGQAAITWFGR